MNWLRDNILKILIILGVVVIAIIILAIVITPRGDSVVSGSKYGELETKLQNAAIKYTAKNKKRLPKSTEEVVKIKLKTLQDNKYIGKLVAVDNRSTVCDGRVEITKLDEEKEEYRYTPYISCGKYYTTKNIGNYIIDEETEEGENIRTSGAGLYKNDNDYIFKGENVNNYIKLDTHLYRIIKIDENESLQLISVNKTSDSYLWDDRYNISKDREIGINDFVKSRLYDTLGTLYEPSKVQGFEVFFTEKEKDYIVEHDFCIGARALSDVDIESGAECLETSSLKVGLITIDEYARASIDPNCKSVVDKSCYNYNFFSKLGTKDSYSYMTLTAVKDNTYEYYKVGYDEILTTKTSNASQIYPVIYINSRTIYSSGTGTASDPYIVR